MSFFAKIKQVLGFVGVKVTLETGKTFSRKGNEISGRLIVSSKTDQHILDMKIELEEQWKTGKGENEKRKNFTLGEWKFGSSFDIKAGETKEFDFNLPYSLLKSDNDRMMEVPAVGKALGTLGKMMDGEKSTFSLTATVDVKGAALDPNCVKIMQIV